MDQDCDGAVDDDPADGQPWYEDADGDGHGSPGSPRRACDAAPAGHVAVDDDCDDLDPDAHPGATERCNGVDDDCDASGDEADAVDVTVYYVDADGDGYGDSDLVVGSRADDDLWVFRGPLTGDFATSAYWANLDDLDDDTPDFWVTQGHYADELGSAVRSTDLDGDGNLDIIAAAEEDPYTGGAETLYRAGAVYAFLGRGL